jgi:nucleotide-binding universal stress UspA family protein
VTLITASARVPCHGARGDGPGIQCGATAELLMKVLIATDYSPAAGLVLDEAVARPWPHGTSFSVVHAVDLYRFTGFPAFREESEHKLKDLDVAMKASVEKLARAGHHPELKILSGFPRTVISQYAKEWNADLVMAGSHGHSAMVRFLIGSVAQGILRTATCSVEIVRSRTGKTAPSSHAMKILLATDNSDCSLRAAHAVANRPWPLGSVFKVLSVEELASGDDQMAWTTLAPIYPKSLLDELIAHGHEQAECAVKAATEILERAGKSVITGEKLPMGDPRALILDTAEAWGADLIVLASHGRRGLDRFIMGSVSETVATYAKCSVQVIRNCSTKGEIDDR